jgi:hypothetical protein
VNGFWTDIIFDGLSWLMKRAGYTVLTKDETLNIQESLQAVLAAQAAEPQTVADATTLPSLIVALTWTAAVNAALAQATRAAADGQAADLSLLQDAQTKLVTIQDTLGPAPV